MPTVALINGSPGHFDGAALAAMVPDFQTWIEQHLAPAWNCPARIVFAASVPEADPAHWWCVINNHSDEADALGYHSTTPAGLPYARIFADDDANAGASLSVTISHELAEMLVNPTAELLVKIGNASYAKEVGDAVEDDSFAQLVGKTLCSDFVLPAYFDPSKPGPYDWQGKLTKPCPAMQPGGYLALVRNGDWQQIMARRDDGQFSHRALRAGRCQKMMTTQPSKA